MAALDSDQVRSLDQTRQLLLSLHTSLVALRSDISQNPQLPSWYFPTYFETTLFLCLPML